MMTSNSVVMIPEPQEGSVIAVGDVHLEYYSSSGWVLIAIIQEEGLRTEEVRVEGSYNSFQKEVPCVTTKYVLRQSRDNTLMNLKEKLDSTSNELRKTVLSNDNLSKELKNGDERIKEATSALEREVCFLKTENERYREQSGSREHEIRELRTELETEKRKASVAIDQLKKMGGMVDDAGMPKVQEKMVREAMRKTNGES